MPFTKVRTGRGFDQDSVGGQRRRCLYFAEDSLRGQQQMVVPAAQVLSTVIASAPRACVSAESQWLQAGKPRLEPEPSLSRLKPLLAAQAWVCEA